MTHRRALNWYSSVREKLDDPKYASWFIKFKVRPLRQSFGPSHAWLSAPHHPTFELALSVRRSIAADRCNYENNRRTTATVLTG